MSRARTTDQPPDLSGLCPAIMDHAPLPMATVEGAAHIVRYVNPAFCDLMDKARERLIGKPFGDMFLEQDECVTLLDRVFRSGKPESHTEQQQSEPHPVFWSYMMWPLLADERPVGVMIQVTETAQFHETTLAMNEALVLGSLRQHELTEAAELSNSQLQKEITGHKQAEEALHASDAERRRLEDSLVARAEELARADRSKDEFLAMLAHELRNPLAPLCNAAEILKVAGASEEERGQAQRIIGRQIENMSRMIDDLLDVSRITEGKIELRLKPVALEAILIAATSLARFGIAGHKQELTVSLPAQPVFLNADATRLEQVFTNLLGNACKYSADGCHIQLNAERAVGIEPPEVIVRVRDDGIGIAAEMLPRVFDLFAQASRTLDRAQGGLGIGLTLVQRLVHLHGGRVEACSDGLGCGSEFIVHLPILREAPPPLVLPLVPTTHERPRRMLIVDDSADAARTLAILQRRRGHETRTAFTGPDAVAVAAEFLPEVVLLDIGLPGMDGFEVARRLRALPALAGVAIVAMTGYGSIEDRARGKEAGFDEYFVKPLDLSRLREWLGSLI